MARTTTHLIKEWDWILRTKGAPRCSQGCAVLRSALDMAKCLNMSYGLHSLPSGNVIGTVTSSVCRLRTKSKRRRKRRLAVVGLATAAGGR